MESLSTTETAITKNIPQLRFPEFDGEWKKSSLENLSEKKISYGIVQTGERIQNGVPCLRVIDLTKSNIIMNELITTSLKISNSYKKTILEKDELMIALRGIIGRTQIVTEELAGFNLTRGIARVSPDDKIILPKYLLKYLNSPESHKNFDKRKNGSALKEIPISELRKFPVKFPSFPEQQKIANFLTQVDRKIELLENQQAALEQYKKGVMQKIFNQEIRFKIKNEAGELVEPPDWEEKKLGEIASKKSSSISANQIEDNEGEYKIYGATGFFKKVDFYKEKEKFISIVKDGAGVGRVLLCDEFSSVLGTLDILKPKREVNLYFLYSILQLMNFLKFKIGSTIPHIYFKDYSKAVIKIPSIEEQDKIANFLSAIDTKIEAVAEGSRSHRKWKKGLLQKMFV